MEPTATIVRWNHCDGGEAHCLVRLFVGPNRSRVVALLSEIESNLLGRELTNDFGGTAEATRRALKRQIEPILENMTWIAHHGRFSFVECLDVETFSMVEVRWMGASANCDDATWDILEEDAVRTVLNGAKLRPVHEVLKELPARGTHKNGAS